MGSDVTRDDQAEAAGAPAAKPVFETPAREPVRRGSNRGIVLTCVGALLFMGAATYAAVPLYRMFCQVTGFGGTPMRADKAPELVVDHAIAVRFDANVTPGMAWQFEPVQRTITLKLGENALVFYRAHNSSNVPVTGTASFNVSPDLAGSYFSKIECFCFKEQTLAPGESIDMPVSFFVDPAILQDRDAAHINEITLSYTFYPVTGGARAAEVKPQQPQKGG
jgi:cytochrome c oxidase assembly protein subunit 11